MNKKGEIIRQYAKDITEHIGKEDAVLIVAHINTPLGCVRALKGTGEKILTALSFAMMEDPDLLKLAKKAIEFVEQATRNKKN